MGNNNFYLCDVLRNLPDSVIDDILTRLTLRNIVRTSILSRKWRYNWHRLPQVKFDQMHWKTTEDLAVHLGPITKFTLDDLIYFLSRIGIQHLVFKPPFRSKPYDCLLHILHVHNWGICFSKTVKYVPLMSLRDWLVN